MDDEVERHAPHRNQSGRIAMTSVGHLSPVRKPAPGTATKALAPGSLPLLHEHSSDLMTAAAELRTETRPPETNLQALSLAEQKGRQQLASPVVQHKVGRGGSSLPAKPDNDSAMLVVGPHAFTGSETGAGPAHDQPVVPLRASISSRDVIDSETVVEDAPRQPGTEGRVSGKHAQSISGKQPKGPPTKTRQKIPLADGREQDSGSDAGGKVDSEAQPAVLRPRQVQGAREQKPKGWCMAQEAAEGSKAKPATTAEPPAAAPVPGVRQRPVRQRKNAGPYWLGAAAAKPSVAANDKAESPGRRPQPTEEAENFAGASPVYAMPLDGGTEEYEESPSDDGATRVRRGRRQRKDEGPEAAEKATKRPRGSAQPASNGQWITKEDQSEGQPGHADNWRKSSNNGFGGGVDARRTSDIPAKPALDRHSKLQGNTQETVGRRRGGSRKRESGKTGSQEGLESGRRHHDTSLSGKEWGGKGAVAASLGSQPSPSRRLTRIAKRQRTDDLPSEVVRAGLGNQAIDASQTQVEPEPKRRQHGPKAADTVLALSPTTKQDRPGKVTGRSPPLEAPAESDLMGPSATSIDTSADVGILKENGQRAAVGQNEPLQHDLHKTSVPPAVSFMSSEELGGVAALVVPQRGDQTVVLPARALQATVRLLQNEGVVSGVEALLTPDQFEKCYCNYR